MKSDFGSVDLSPYEVTSRREIISLLRSIKDQNQLVSMLVSGGTDAVVTSILEIDDVNNLVIVDCAPDARLNQRLLTADRVAFETVLEQIRILFSTEEIEECTFENLPAFWFPLPQNMIRLQRRESYRVPTPIANPIRCIIPLPDETGEAAVTAAVALHNISAGGIAIVDDTKILDNTIGRIYTGCRLDLPGGTPIVVTLQVRNCQELTLTNGRTMRRLGCMFIDLSPSLLAAVQRYLTKLEREYNARKTGMR